VTWTGPHFCDFPTVCISVTLLIFIRTHVLEYGCIVKHDLAFSYVHGKLNSDMYVCYAKLTPIVQHPESSCLAILTMLARSN